MNSAIALLDSNLVPEAVTNHLEPSNNSTDSIKQVNLKAIAAQLNAHFKPQGITLRANWKGADLVLLAEAQHVPQADELLPQIHQQLEVLQLDAVRIVRVYARIPGHSQPEWGRKITLAPPAPDQASICPVVSPSATTVADWLAQGQIIRAQEPTSVVHQLGNELRFLACCWSADDTVLIPLADIQSIFKVRLSAIVPVPEMPDAVLGLYSYQGEMLWMVDLNAQLGIHSWTQDASIKQDLTAIVMIHKTTTIGFVTQAEIAIETQAAKHFLNVNEELFSTQVMPYLAGYIQASGSPVLDVSALIRRP